MAGYFAPQSEEKRQQKRAETILGIFEGLINVVIIVIGILTLLSEFGIDITPILASAGILGLAVGFGAQTLVKDFINGIFILIEDQFSEGDVVQIDSFRGTVEDMSLRSTSLRDSEGVLHIIPNNTINDVSNLNRDYGVANVEIKFPKDIKIDNVQKVLREAIDELLSTKKMSEQIVKKPQILGIEELDEGRFNFYSVKISITTKPLQQYEVARKYRYLVKKEMESLVEKESN